MRVGRALLLTCALLISPAVAAPAAGAPLPPKTADAGKAAAGWLADQVEQGGLTPSNLADAVIAFAATGVGATAAATALTQLESGVDAYIVSNATLLPGAVGKVMLAVAIAGGDVNSFGGHDLEADLRGLMAGPGPNEGQFGSASVYDQSLAILALATIQFVLFAGCLVIAQEGLARGARGGALNHPGSLSATGISTSATQLSWRDTNTNETGYSVFRSQSATSGFVQVASVSKKVTSYVDSGLAAATTYYYQVYTLKRSTLSAAAAASARTLGAASTATRWPTTPTRSRSTRAPARRPAAPSASTMSSAR